MANIKRTLGMAFIFAYPVFIFLSLVVFKLPLSIISIGLVIMAIVMAGFRKGVKSNIPSIVLGAIALVVIITNSSYVLEYYPICTSLLMIGIFGGSVIRKDPFIFRFAVFADPSITVHPAEKTFLRWCYGLHWLWILQGTSGIIVNTIIIRHGTIEDWTRFNAAINYIVITAVVLIQFVVIYISNRIAYRKLSFSDLSMNAYPKDYVLAYTGTYKAPGSEIKVWPDLINDIRKATVLVSSCDDDIITVNASDMWNLLVTVLAALGLGKTPMISSERKPSISEETLMACLEDATSPVSAPRKIDPYARILADDGEHVFSDLDDGSFPATLWNITRIEGDGKWKFLPCPEQRTIPRMIMDIIAKKE